MKKKEYTVIIGDLIASKKIKNRQEVQEKFQETLLRINRDYQSSIASKFTISLGDEFQALLMDKKSVIQIILAIEAAMYPVQVRFGIGIGQINTEIDYENSVLIDGPAYHRARAMMLELEKTEQQYEQREANILISSAEQLTREDRLLNASLSLATVIKNQWTTRQAEIIQAYRLNNQNQYKTAEKLGIGQSSVSKALKAANFISYQSALNEIEFFLSEKGED